MSVDVGSVVFDRYTLTARIGRGTYGSVFKAYDMIDRTQVAVKISTGTGLTHTRNVCEGSILKILTKSGSPYSHLVVELKAKADKEGCVVLILELLSHNLRDAIRNNVFNNMFVIYKYGKQMMEFLCYMSSMDIIHGDIKPENILVQAGAEHRIKFNDFGLSYCPQVGHKMRKIQSLFYRAPEVVLGYNYEKEVDVWGIGCVLLDLAVGWPVFQVRDELELMTMIVDLVGMPPEEVIEMAPHRDQFFMYDENYKQWLVRGMESPEEPEGIDNYLRRCFNTDFETVLYKQFVDLVEGMLKFSPCMRMTPEECLSHPFFT